MEKKTQIRLLLCIALWAILYLWGLGIPHVDYSIEAMRVVMAQNMLDSGEWLVPEYRGEVYLTKPPLMNWLIALFSLPVGEVTELTGRLPSVLSVLALAFIVWYWAARCGRSDAGYYGAILFMILPLVFEKGTRAEIDMNFSLWVSLSVLCLFNATSAELPNASSSRRWMLAAYGFLAIAFLSKGPPALLFFFGTLIVWQTLRGWAATKPLDHVLGLLLAGGVLALWIVPMLAQVGVREAWQTLNAQALQRVVSASEVNSAPFYFYIPSVAGGALPAVFFFLWLRPGTLDAPAGALARFTISWLLSAAVLFSLVAGKESRYLLPVYPAVALLGGFGFIEFITRAKLQERNRYPRIVLHSFAAVFTLAGIGLFVWHQKANPGHPVFALLWAVVFSAGGVAFWLTWKKLGVHKAFPALLVCTFALKGFYLTGYTPMRAADRSPKLLAQELRAQIPRGAVVHVIRTETPQIDFYMKEPVRYYPDAEAFIGKNPNAGKYYLWTDERNWPEPIRAKIKEQYRVVRVKDLSYRRRGYTLIELEKTEKEDSPASSKTQAENQ